MKLLAIILTFFSFTAKAQYVAMWDSYGHTLYKVQQTSDTTKTWKNIGQVSSNITDTSFSYTLPQVINVYYRIIADKEKSKVIFLYNNPPIITEITGNLKITLLL